MLGLDNPIHIVFILVLLLLVFGAKRLPELGRSLGTGMRGFKDSIGGEETSPALGAGHGTDHVEALSAVQAPMAPERHVEALSAVPAPLAPMRIPPQPVA